MAGSRLTVRELFGTEVTGTCMDCGQEFQGALGVRFLETAEGPGIEITVTAPDRQSIHTLGRVRRDLVPVVHIADDGEEEMIH